MASEIRRKRTAQKTDKSFTQNTSKAFVDNQKLQVKAEKAKDVVNIDTARQIKQLKELLKECKEVFDECFSPSAEHGKLYKKIDEALK